ncbi:MAG: hypothetical protein G01um10143_130 [Parcubacteria group bacterium Gr01-1014_3]|nr:MAG: hypothetical protein G01um10143_130 [Parcubacteria group bacterium Gr01-1014_3]
MGTYIPKNEIDKALASVPVKGKKLLEPFKSFAAANKLPFNILEDANVSNLPELHKTEADLWFCLEGEITFIYGGELMEPVANKNPDGTNNEMEWKGKEIRGGTEVVFKPGDWLWIPPGEPHQHNCAGIARLAIIKIPAILS